MKITNELKLPEAIVAAITNDGYSRGNADISVTQLISPPRKVTLEHEHADELSEDASDRIYALLGQSVHTILERANRAGIAEKRFFMTVEDWVVSGAFDAYYENGLLQDYKITSAWAAKGPVKPEWEQQLNIGRVMIEGESGIKITKLQIVAILRDWSKMEAARSPDYPQLQVVVLDVPVWSDEKTLAFLRERVILHKQARISLPECTAEERWEKPTVYAVMKAGNKRAVRLYESESEATAHASREKNLSVVKRLGESTRCRFYCNASAFCKQAQSNTADEASKESEIANAVS